MNSKIYFLCIIILCNFTQIITAQKGDIGSDDILKKYQEKIDFVPNQGQWEKEIVYQADISKTQVRFLNDKVSFGALTENNLPKRPNLDSIEKASKTKEEAVQNKREAREKYAKQKGFVKGFVWNMRFDGAGTQSQLLGKEERETKYNYYLGALKAEEVVAMAEVWYQDIYPNTDVRFYSAKDGLEYDIILYPKAKVEHVKIELEGIEEISLDKKGNLVYGTPWGEMMKEAPYAYQIIDGQEIAIATKYRLDGNYLTFELWDDYDKERPLVIDPLILKWSTYLGGAGDDDLRSEAIYNDELYLYGSTLSIGYPTTAGSFQQTYGGGITDLFFSKLDTDGNLLVSTFVGGNGEDYTGWDLFQDGSWYIEGTAESTNLPTTAGAFQTTFGGGSGDAFFIEVNSNLLLEYSTYLGGTGFESLSRGVYNPTNNLIYLNGRTGDNTTFPATKTTLNNQSGSSDFILRYNTTSHQIEEVATVSSEFDIEDLVLDGTNVFALGGVNFSSTTYTTLGAFQTIYGGGSQDLYVLKLTDDLDPLFATYIGGDGYEEIEYFEIKDGSLYLLGISGSTNFPTTNGAFQTAYGGGFRDLFAVKMDLLGNVLYSTYLGGSDTEELSIFADNRGIVDNGNFYILGETESSDFPATTGAFQTFLRGTENNFIAKINASGQADWATYFSGGGVQGLLDYTILDNELVILGYSTTRFSFPTTTGAFQTIGGGSFDWTFSRLNLSTGYPNYSTYIGGSGSEFGGEDHLYIEGTDVYVIGETSSSDFPVTSGATQANFGGRQDWAIVKINSNNNFEYATYLGGNASDVLDDNVRIENGKIHILGETDFFSTVSAFNTYPTTTTAFQNTHRQTAEGDFYYSQLDANTGALLYSTLIGGSGRESYIFNGFELLLSGEEVYVLGGTNSVDFPVTQGATQTTYGGDDDIFVLKLSPCVDSIQPDTVLPLSQTVCIEATAEPFIGGDTEAAFPLVLRNNIPDTYVPSSPSFAYQWQDSIAGGTWSNISGATGADFLPPELTITTYYRRAVLNTCGAIIGYSNEAVVNVTGDQAPVVDGGDNLLICTGGSIQIGAPTTGGTPNYTYSWTPTTGLSDPTLEQPTATVTSSTVYTVEVTDANGCIHKDQAIVNVLTASAGPDVFACQGAGVRIGTPAPAGATSLNYAWTPTTGLSDPFIAQPIANPATTTTYTLTVTGPDGCPLVDDVVVTPINLPNAGSDETICLGSSVTLGQPSLAGYTYEWSPGVYLSNASIAQPIFGASSIPSPNPLTYSLTTMHTASGCSATSAINITVSGANAGIDGCGPRLIGTPDQSGGAATYSWTVVSGDAASLTTPNIPEPIVNPSSNTTYELSVSLNGITCTDQVLVTANCGCPAFNLTASSDINCAIGDSTTNTTLSSDFTDTANYLFSWSPAADLSSTNTPSTSIIGSFTNNRTYTLTITNKLDPVITCSQNIQVLGASTALPVVSLNDTVGCFGVGIQIGTNPVVGRSYRWIPNTDLSDAAIANPIATLEFLRVYILEVTDDITGCSSRDTSLVVIRNVGADAGEDAEFCDGAVITLGTPALPNRIYDWQPANALGMPNNAQPTDTIFITTDYYLTVTDTLSGCTERDTITFTEKTAPTADAGVDSVRICQGGSIRIGTPAVAGVSYSWLPTAGLSNPTIAQPLAAPTNTTTYQLIASISGVGCYAVDEITVEVTTNNAPPASAGNNQALCLGNSTSIGILGSPNLVYEWSPTIGLNDSSLAQPTATPIDTTTYILTVTDTITGCVNVDDITLFVGALPTVDAGRDRTDCPDGFTRIGPFSNNSDYTYSWSPITGLDDPSSNRVDVDLPPNSNILYTLMVTDAAGCVASDTVRVIIEGIPFVDAGPDVTTCDSVQIGTPAISGLSYSWSPSDGLSSRSVAQPIATIEETRTYILRVFDSNFCDASDTVVVTPTAIASAGADQVICNGGSVLIGTPSMTGTTYNWTPSSGLDDPTAAQPTASPMSTTTYVVSATNGTCAKTDTMVVTVVSPTIDLGGDVVVCNGSCINIGIPSQSGKTYQWSPNVGINSPNDATTNACPTSTTIYTLTETDIAMGCVATDDILIEVKSAAPPIVDAGQDTTICPGNVVSLGASNTVNYTYTWTPVVGLSDPFVSNPISSPSSSTSYIVNVVDNTTGCFNSDTVTISIGALPSIPPLNDIAICTGSSSLIGASENSAYTYLWSPTTGLNDPTVPEPIVTPSATTTYQLLVTDTASGCTSSSSLVVSVVNSATPVIADAGQDIDACIGDVVTLGSSNTTSGAAYTWSPNTLLSSGSVATPTKTIPGFWTSGAYRLTVTSGGCTSIDEVVVRAKPEVTIEAGEDIAICGTTTTLDAVPTSVTNQWSLVSGPNVPIFGDINSASSSLSGLIPGVYILRWNVSGISICNPGSDQVQITVGANPQLTINDPSIACPTVDITAPSITTGSTLNGAILSYWIDSTTNIPVGNPSDIGFSGQYFIRARTNLGCESIEEVNVTIDCNSIFLPVDLLAFDARLLDKNTAFLDWETAEETNILGFEIEHALPSSGIPVFEKVDFVESKGGGSAVHYYTHEVENLITGTHYFRLKQLEVNGLYTYSEIRAVSVDNNNPTILVYPNPATDRVTIELSEMPKGKIHVEVINTLGQTLYQQDNLNTQFININLTSLVSASYMIRVQYENQIKVFKLIKQ